MSAVRSPAGVPSPCVSVCRLSDRTGLCEGCLRTVDEIIAWSGASDEAKLAIWRQLPARLAEHPHAPLPPLPPGLG